MTHWGTKAQGAYESQWLSRHPDSTFWDWTEIFRRHRNELEIAIWSPVARLSGLSVATASGEAIEVRFLEGDSRPDCPLKGSRMLIALDCASRYAYGRGKRELRVRPVNSALEDLYQEIYGFHLVKDKPGSPYWARRIP